MSSTRVAPPVEDRRVRHQARDAAVLMGFSLTASTGLALLLLLLATLAPRG